MTEHGFYDGNTKILTKLNSVYSSDIFDTTGAATDNVTTGYKIDDTDIGSVIRQSYGIYNDLSISSNFSINGTNITNLFRSFAKLPPILQYSTTDPAALKIVDLPNSYRLFYFYRSRIAKGTYYSTQPSSYGDIIIKSPHPGINLYTLTVGGGGSGGSSVEYSWAAGSGGGAGAYIDQTVRTYPTCAFYIKSIGGGGAAVSGNANGNGGGTTEVNYGEISELGVKWSEPAAVKKSIAGGGGGGGGGDGFNKGNNYAGTAQGSGGGAINGGGASPTNTLAHTPSYATNTYDFGGSIYVKKGGDSYSGICYKGTPQYVSSGTGGGGAGTAGTIARVQTPENYINGGDGGNGRSWWADNKIYAAGGGGAVNHHMFAHYGAAYLTNGTDGSVSGERENTGSGGSGRADGGASGAGADGIVAVAIPVFCFKRPNYLYLLYFGYVAGNTSTIYASNYSTSSNSNISCSTRKFIWDRDNTTATILIVGGGGGGGGGEGYEAGGGGGGGGVVTGYIPLIKNVEYTITVGQGGTGGNSGGNGTSGTKGTNSSISWTTNTITAYGGGGGSIPRASRTYYADGGSGGGTGGGYYTFQSGEATRGNATGDIATRHCLAFWGNEGEINHVSETTDDLGGGGGGGAIQRAWTNVRDSYLGYYYTGHDGGEGLSWFDDNVYGSGGGGGVGVIPHWGAYYFGGVGGTNAGFGAGQSDRDKVYGDKTLGYDASRLYTDAEMNGATNFGGGGGGGNGSASDSLKLMNGGNGGSGRVIIAPIDYTSSAMNYWNLNSPS